MKLLILNETDQGRFDQNLDALYECHLCIGIYKNGTFEIIKNRFGRDRTGQFPLSQCVEIDVPTK